MLKTEQAEEQLLQWRLNQKKSDQNRDDADEPQPRPCLARIKKLPPTLRGLAPAICGLDEKGNRLGWGERGTCCRKAATALAKESASNRAKVFGALLPGLVQEMEATWQLFATLPYQTGYARKPFRAPGAPQHAAARRGEWISGITECLEHYDPKVVTPAWIAAWGPHLTNDGDSIGYLLAAIINGGGKQADEVLQILKDSASNQHEIGHMGRHVTRALLTCNRPEAWEFVEKLLLAAQRQEGLRQTILETIDEAHPEAFRRMVRLILDQKLVRFSSVVRAFDVWFGLMWDSASPKTVTDALQQVHEFLAVPASGKKALAGKDAEAVYLALWAAALEDAPAAVKLAQPVLKDPKVEKRFAAAKLLTWVNLPESSAALAPMLDDADLRVALTACSGQFYDEDEESPCTPDLFERLERLLNRLPEKPVQLKPLVWPWTAIKCDRAEIANQMVAVLGDRSVAKLLPLLPILSGWQRHGALLKVVGQKKYDNATREVLLRFAADASTNIRELAVGAIVKTALKPDEAPQMEKTLTRKAADVRRSVIGLLLTQSDAATLASAGRLIASKDANQRLAGLELLRQMAEGHRQVDRCRAQGEAYRSARKKISKEEETQLAALARAGEKQVTLDDALGLVDVKKLTPRTPPKARKVTLMTPAAIACIKSLDELIHENRQTPIRSEADANSEATPELLGNRKWFFASVVRNKPPEEAALHLPLRELWETWYSKRPKALRDKDGLELLRAYVYLKQRVQQESGWQGAVKKSSLAKKVAEAVAGKEPPPKVRYGGIIDDVLEWLIYLHPVAGSIDYLLDAAETSLALVPESELVRPRPPLEPGKARVPSYLRNRDPEIWREFWPFRMWKEAAEEHLQRYRNQVTPAQRVRWWRLEHWCDAPIPGEYRDRPKFENLLVAWEASAANEHDVLDHLLGSRHAGQQLDERAKENSWRYRDFDSLSSYTSPLARTAQSKSFERSPQLAELLDRCRERILEIELARGETPTAATAPALSISSLHGVPKLVRLLTEMGKQKFKKDRYSWRHSESRSQVLSQLVSKTFATSDDTPETFCQAIAPLRKEKLIDEQRLNELAFLAPQWLPHIEAALAWPGFAEGVYWYLAHMSYADTSGLNNAETAQEAVESDTATAAGEPAPVPDKRSTFERIVAERTPLTTEQRRQGAIDVAWFRRTYALLGKKRWEILENAGKLAASSQQAAKAGLIGDVILGRASKAKLVANIRKKKLRNDVRLLGLFPLPEADEPRRKELRERYKVLQDYQRYARTLSALSKPSAIEAVETGLANLASTAGFPDALRMTWALEAEGLADLRSGPVSATAEGVTATLSLNGEARPELVYSKADKTLKSAPASVRKHKKVAELVDRYTELKRAASRVRTSLETMMCRGDTFSGDELKQLAAHPLIWPLLSRLVIVGEGIMGYPDKEGAVLRGETGTLEPIKKGEKLRIAHCHDLWASGNWPAWQHECFAAERVQPIKQLFRELYLLTDQERADHTLSRRYAGQQIHPRQAISLFGQRGWRTQEGVEKTFYDLELNADVHFGGGWGSPTDVEGLTLEGVAFRRRDKFEPLPLAEVPPRVFSEVMRDLDLVVSVAHRGEVDPEASASTVEMRGTLVEETCELLSIDNVVLKNSHAIVKGNLSEYTIHLGSGVVHRQPGGSLCIVAVGAQHRGRLFLPFADDDPRTAEIISKVLLLAKDSEIQDPTILEQIRR